MVLVLVFGISGQLIITIGLEQQAAVVDMRVINLSVGSGLIVLFDVPVLFWLTLTERGLGVRADCV